MAMRNLSEQQFVSHALHTILICPQADKTELIQSALMGSEFQVGCHAASLSQIAASEVTEHSAMLIIVTAKCDENLSALITTLLKHQPLPVVIFTEEFDALAQQQAIRAGVSAYVVDGLHAHRLVPLLKMAETRFRQQQMLEQRLVELETKLADRKVIDRAKGLVMQQRQCSEDEAYKLLRTTAMNKNMRLAMLAQQVLASANLLETPVAR